MVTNFVIVNAGCALTREITVPTVVGRLEVKKRLPTGVGSLL